MGDGLPQAEAALKGRLDSSGCRVGGICTTGYPGEEPFRVTVACRLGRGWLRALPEEGAQVPTSLTLLLRQKAVGPVFGRLRKLLSLIFLLFLLGLLPLSHHHHWPHIGQLCCSEWGGVRLQTTQQGNSVAARAHTVGLLLCAPHAGLRTRKGP